LMIAANVLKVKDDVLKLILEVANSLINFGPMFNERYLHHFFTCRLQEKLGLGSPIVDGRTITLHPEWPTSKKVTGLRYGQYKKDKHKKYVPTVDGRAGFIDFAIGDYKSPEIGIEFSMSSSWRSEAIIFDFIKLLDNRNPFRLVFSLNLILREKGLVRGGNLGRLEKRMNEAFDEATRRLGDKVRDNLREVYFLVTEIASDNNRRHWYYDKTSRSFRSGLPTII